MALFDSVIEELPKWITGIRIESAWLPPVYIRDPFAAAPGPVAPNPVLSALKPRVTLEVRGGSMKPIVTAPYGDPGVSRWPVLRTGLVVVGIGGLLLLARAKRRRKY
jgi:hypothetical protein